MVSRIVSIMVLIFVGMVFAGEEPQQQKAPWVQQWWKKELKPTWKRQQKKLRNSKIKQCDEMLNYYDKKVEKDPKSEYYQWKLEDWKKKCIDRKPEE